MNPIDRHRMRSLDDDRRYEYLERIAVCTVDGGLPEDTARRIAWAQVHPTSPVSPRVRPGPPQPNVRSTRATRRPRGPTGADATGTAQTPCEGL